MFFGRESEIYEINEILKDNQLVFLSGIGGIGKTEIAKKYSHQYRNNYNSITFSLFFDNIKTLVCDEININNIERDENEDDDSYFNRKIKILKKISSPEDLIIIDNFDVDLDENLETLLECPCKFIFTTRKDFKDFNFKQINIEKMKNIDEVLELFYTYNEIEYDENEKDAINKIITKVEHHTMTVELIAKYLRISGENPSNLLNRFEEKEGITNTDDINIKQRKDLKLRAESVNNHLSILFDVINFDKYEKEIISSLSLFAGIRIHKQTFINICKVNYINGKLNNLIKNGWIEYNEISEKISLHQVIQDIVYSKLNPDSDNCAAITKGILEYISESKISLSEKKIRRKVLNIFVSRLKGTNLEYAELCLECKNEEKLIDAEKICLAIKTPESYNILYRIYLNKMLSACTYNYMVHSESDIKEYGRLQIEKIYNYLEIAIKYCNLVSDDKLFRIKEYINICEKLEGELSTFLFDYDGNEPDIIYNRIMELYEWSGEQLKNIDIDVKEKERLYKKIQKFFSDEDMFTSMYRYEHFSDIEKAYYYQKILDELRSSGESDSYNLSINDGTKTHYYWTNDISCFDLAEKYRKEGKYEDAINMYLKSFEKLEDPYEFCMRNISNTYLEMGDIKNAILYLEKVLENDKQNILETGENYHYSCFICLDLIKLLIDCNRLNTAKKYAEELINIKIASVNEIDASSYDICYVISAYFYLYSIDSEEKNKTFYWKQCVEYYKKLNASNIDSDISDFIYKYISVENVEPDEALNIVKRIDDLECDDLKIKILNYTINKFEKRTGYEKNIIYCLIELANIFNEFPYSEIKKAYYYCEKAEKLFLTISDNDEYLLNIIFKLKASIMSNDDSSEFDDIQSAMKKCNYRLIAEIESKISDNEKKLELWNSAANSYHYIDDYENESICLNESYIILRSILNQYDYSNFDTSLRYVMENLVRSYIRQNNFESAKIILIEWYEYSIDFLMENQNFERYQSNIIWMFRDISKYFIEINNIRFAINIYVIDMYLIVTDKIDFEVLSEKALDNIDIELLCKSISEFLKKDNIVMIDDLIDINNELLRIIDAADFPGALKPIVEKITDIFQNSEIEFKE